MDAQGKSLTSSKTINFNIVSGVVIHAVWPLLPKTFREQPYSMSAVTSWFAIGNIVLRFMTTEALAIMKRRPIEAAKKDQ